MPYTLPVKGLVRLNVAISFLFSILLTIFLLALDFDFIGVVLRFFQSFIFLILISFGNLGLFSFNLEKRKKIPKFILYLCSYLWGVVAWILVVSLHSLVTGKDWEGKGGDIVAYVLTLLSIFFFNTVVLIVQNLLIFQHRNAQIEIEKLQLKANVSNTTNLLLRQQIQPHFLFNALTTLKSLYKKDIKLGDEYLMHLANFLRVSVSNTEKSTALVKDEIDFCLNYLKMQKIRFGTAVEYDINLTENGLNKGYLPYFSLQPLIENVLKHNRLTEEEPIKIDLYEKDGFIAVKNNLQENLHKEKSAGNGLYNLGERYRLMGEEEIRITSGDTYFTVYLKILER